jgi:hypothetical protein
MNYCGRFFSGSRLFFDAAADEFLLDFACLFFGEPSSSWPDLSFPDDLPSPFSDFSAFSFCFFFSFSTFSFHSFSAFSFASFHSCSAFSAFSYSFCSVWKFGHTLPACPYRLVARATAIAMGTAIVICQTLPRILREKSACSALKAKQNRTQIIFLHR